MELEPPEFCAIPVVLKLAFQDIQPYSIFVSWKGRNHTGLHGYRVAYYPIEDPDYPAAAISSVAVTPNVSHTIRLRFFINFNSFFFLPRPVDHEQVPRQKHPDNPFGRSETGDPVLGVRVGLGQLDNAEQFTPSIGRHPEQPLRRSEDARR